MVKKLNQFGVTVKSLLQRGYSHIWIARKLKVKRQKVNYWAKHPIKTKQKRRRKLEEKYIKKIIDLAENKTTSMMSSSRITRLINKELLKDGKKCSIHKVIVCSFLNIQMGKSRKIFI